MPIMRPEFLRHRYQRVARLVCIAALLASCLAIADPTSTAAATPGAATITEGGARTASNHRSVAAGDAITSPVKVMPLGDSITDGYNIPGGYRTELWRLLGEAGYGIDFVGSQQSGPASLPDKHHEGHPGWCINPIASSVPGWLATYQPDVVLLLIGTNDLHEDNYPGAWNNGCNYDEAATRLSTLIDTITAASPSVRVIVGTLPPQVGSVSNERVQAFNAAIPGMVGNKAANGAQVSWADINGALTLADLADKVHPNAEGYRKIAQVWREALLRCESGFADVPSIHPACASILALTGAGIINGYATTPPTFGPGDPVQRAQIAAFLVRALQWQGAPTGPKSFTDFGQLVAELQTASLILANQCDPQGKCVGQGYDAAGCAARGKAAPCFGPSDNVSYAQAISFVARAFQHDPAYAWQPSAAAHPYSGVPAVHEPDVRAYHAAAGTIPDAPTTVAAWSQPAPRAWVALVIYRALQSAP